jgi:hypothetical protein
MVTIHEFSIAHPLRQLMIRALLLFAVPIFTNEAERRSAGRFARRAPTIPIGSNIDGTDRKLEDRAANPSIRKVISFGRLDHRSDDLQMILHAGSALARTRPGVELVVLGSAHDEWKPATAASNTRIVISPSDDALLAELNEADAAFQYYSDGASDRRGSLLAVMSAGIPVATNHTDSTPAWIQQCTVPLQPEAPHRAIEELEARLRSAAPSLTSSHIKDRSWPSIAQAHQRLYTTELSCATRSAPSFVSSSS